MRWKIISFFIVCSLLDFHAKSAEDTCVVRIEKISDNLKKAKQYDEAAAVAWETGRYAEALDYTSRGLKLCNGVKFNPIKAKLLDNRGIAYDYLGDYTSALSNYFKALRIQEKLDDPAMEAYILGNIGLIYSNQRLMEKALNYHNRSLKIRKKLNDLSGISASLNNIAIVFVMKKEYKSALVNYKECMRMDEKAGDVRGLGTDYNNIGICYMGLEEFDTALDYYEKALEIRKRTNDPRAVIETYTNFGSLYYEKKEFEKAREYFLMAIPLAKKLNSKESLKYTYSILYQTEEELNNTAEAFNYYKLFIIYSDSIDNSDKAREQTELELQFQFDKEKEVTRLLQEKKDAQNKIIIYSVSFGLLLIVFFSMLLFRRWKQTQRQQVIIDEKNKLVQRKNDEITDSITYAKRIQTAILPSSTFIKEVVPKNFVLYFPKDIVAGDFYWLEQQNGYSFFAVADCTGHGVPGAMMSVVCHNALNRCIREYALLLPGEILDKTREIIIEELSKSDQVIADGMDISLCVLNEKTKELQWAGANNPLWIYRTENKKIEEWKADKQPIGNHWKYTPFTTQTIHVSKDDRIYLFSDGFSDQFGGPLGKKLMSKGFKQLLLESAESSYAEQKKSLSTYFFEWKGDLEQIDDVCVLCFTIS